MIMADQDQDGSHIKGLVINFIHYKWPNLLKHDYIEVFITPILKVKYIIFIEYIYIYIRTHFISLGIKRSGSNLILLNA
jgi:DNA gyrase/topoisomerase IV subunit B